MDFDDFKLRELRARDGVRVFQAPSKARFDVTATAVAGHVVRVGIQRVGARNKVLADLGYGDVHFAPEQDLEALIMKEIKRRIFVAPEAEKAQGAAADYLSKKWGAPPP